MNDDLLLFTLENGFKPVSLPPSFFPEALRNEIRNGIHFSLSKILVNDIFLTSVTHDEAINILRNAGSEINLTVKHYKSAAPFLLKQHRQFIPDMDTNSPGKFLISTKCGQNDAVVASQ